MRLAVSNIALPAYDHAAELARLPALGFEGLEVSPSRVWPDWWHALDPSRVEDYRRMVENAGLTVVGLHTLFWDMPELGLFRSPEARARTIDYLVHLSRLCADLGGRVLVYGSGRSRMRGALSVEDAIGTTVAFFQDLAPSIEGHGTCFAFEPLAPQDTDFINSVREALRVVDGLAAPVLRTHLDAKALVQAGEADAETFALAASSIAHFHANEADFGVLEAGGDIDHARLGSLLRDIDYRGFVSLEQRQLSEKDPLGDIALSAAVMKECYA